MKALTLTFALLGYSVNAAPPASQDLCKEIKSARTQYGLDNFKVVMPGVLYRGGNGAAVQGVKGTAAQKPMDAAPAQALCNDGFDAAVYGYSKGWTGGAKSLSCKSGQLTYVMKRWDNLSEVRDVMKELHDIIVQGKGAMYVHCWYGVHASGYIVAAALKQFCGYSDKQAVDYWNCNVPKSIQYPKVQQMVTAFKPDPALAITAEQQARVCPGH